MVVPQIPIPAHLAAQRQVVGELVGSRERQGQHLLHVRNRDALGDPEVVLGVQVLEPAGEARRVGDVEARRRRNGVGVAAAIDRVAEVAHPDELRPGLEVVAELGRGDGIEDGRLTGLAAVTIAAVAAVGVLQVRRRVLADHRVDLEAELVAVIGDLAEVGLVAAVVDARVGVDVVEHAGGERDLVRQVRLGDQTRIDDRDQLEDAALGDVVVDVRLDALDAHQRVALAEIEADAVADRCQVADVGAEQVEVLVRRVTTGRERAERLTDLAAPHRACRLAVEEVAVEAAAALRVGRLVERQPELIEREGVGVHVTERIADREVVVRDAEDPVVVAARDENRDVDHLEELAGAGTCAVLVLRETRLRQHGLLLLDGGLGALQLLGGRLEPILHLRHPLLHEPELLLDRVGCGHAHPEHHARGDRGSDHQFGTHWELSSLVVERSARNLRRTGDPASIDVARESNGADGPGRRTGSGRTQALPAVFRRRGPARVIRGRARCGSSRTFARCSDGGSIAFVRRVPPLRAAARSARCAAATIHGQRRGCPDPCTSGLGPARACEL